MWVGVVAQSTGQALPLGEVMMDLVRWLLVPLALGQLLRPWLGGLAQRHKPKVNRVDRGVILLLVYTSFCDSVRRGVWTDNGWLALGLVTAVSIGLFFVTLQVVRMVSRGLGFSRADEIAAIFCGSKKTLAAGVPMAQLIFGTHPGMGLILLPIMIYHPMQLIICSVLASRWAKRAGD